METSPLDPSLTGVRLLQSRIREQLPLSIAVVGEETIEGRLIWQDPEFLAIERAGSSRPFDQPSSDQRDPLPRLNTRHVARSQPCRALVP